jgi:hypothetical protein
LVLVVWVQMTVLLTAQMVALQLFLALVVLEVVEAEVHPLMMAVTVEMVCQVVLVKISMVTMMARAEAEQVEIQMAEQVLMGLAVMVAMV